MRCKFTTRLLHASTLLLAVITLAASHGCGRASITFALGGDDGTLVEKTVIDEHGGAKVALIDVRGLIVDSPRSAWLGESTNPVDDLVARLEKAADDREVRAVLLRINSPGGGVAASETMYREVRRFREKTGKPVVISMGEVAASGGYYLALAGDEIFAQPTTITGSIGVIIPSINFSGALNRWGIESRAIKSGRNKDLGNPLEPRQESHTAVLQLLVDDFYASFRALVIERRSPRGLAATEIDSLTDGRVFSGAEAARLGLVDQTGDLRAAFDHARTLAGLDHARLVKYYSRSSGNTPRTAYALADDSVASSARASGPGDVNLLKLELGESLLGVPGAGGGAYYLWAPSLLESR